MGIFVPTRYERETRATVRAANDEVAALRYLDSRPDAFAGTMAARDTSVAWMTFMGIPQDTDGIDQYNRLADYAEAPANAAFVYACVHRIFTAAAATPFKVKVKQGKDLIPLEEVGSGDDSAGKDLQCLLDMANPVDMSGSELRAYTRAAAKVWGGWYWKVVRGKVLKDPQELYWLPVPDVKAKSHDGRTVDTYEYRPTYRPGEVSGILTGEVEVISPKDMIRRRGLNMRSMVDMISPLSAARFDMVVEQAASLHTASILRRRGVPEGVWTAKQGVQLTRADKSAIRRYLRGLVGPRNAGKSLVAPDIEFQAISLPEKDAEWLEARKVSRMMVSAILGVPLVLAGDDEKAGVYASIRDAQRVFWKDTMIPDLDGDADTINNWLTPAFQRDGDPELVVVGDYSGVEAIRPMWAEETNAWIGMVQAQIQAPNGFNRHFGYPEVPWGDKPIPRTTIAVKAPDTVADLPFVTGESVTKAAVGADASLVMDASGTAVSAEPDDDPTNQAEDAARSISSLPRLYAHPAIKRFIGGDALDMAALGLPEAYRSVVEDGLRRRQSAAQIAHRMLAMRQSDVGEAVTGQLRAQWPDKELDVVKQGDWKLKQSVDLKDIDYARRPVARNPQKVKDFTAALSVGAPMRPAVLLKDKHDGFKYTPIDGWHHLLAADHAGMDEVPAYIGDGTPEWINALKTFNDSIPTPKG